MKRRVSADYLLGREEGAALSVSGLTQSDIGLVYSLIEHLREKNRGEK